MSNNDLSKQEIMAFPCGKCPECLQRRASGWSFRLMQEERVSTSAFFITLTYAPEHLPISRAGFKTLNKTDVQKFVKRLRKAHEKETGQLPIKYYVCGEYGGQTARPHYHMILFNAVLSKIDPAWNLGKIYYGFVAEASVGYTLKYMSKPPRIPMHRNDDRLREFSLMSKGLGKSYMSEAVCKWHHEDLENRYYLPLMDGKKIAMPRYYKLKMYDELERNIIGHHLRVRNKEEVQDNPDPNYWRDKAMADAASFNNMYHAAERGRNKL